MELKPSVFTRTNNFLSHAILSSVNDGATRKAYAKQDASKENDTELTYDIKLIFEGVEIDLVKFFERLENSWETSIKNEAVHEARVLFEKFKNDYVSKECNNSKLESIRKQIEKCNNQMLNISKLINEIK